MNKKSFFGGAAVGIAVVVSLNFLYTSAFGFVFNWRKELTIEQKADEIYKILDDNYVNDYDKKAIADTMFMGMVYGIGDPYTSYMDKETFTGFMEQTDGTYAGVGMVVEVDPKDNRVMISLPYEGYPGAKAGILPGDKIVAVNGVDVTAEKLQNVVNMLKGQPGTSVDVTILRESENRTFDVTLVREKIEMPTVSSKVLENDIGYIRITNFERVTYNQFKSAYDDLTAQGVKGLVLDVRNNPGGLLNIVADIADVLIPEGRIVYTEDKYGKKEEFLSDKNHVEVPLAVLVNGNSASASEVLSGAIKDTGMGLLVGTQTYGKGVVQNIFRLVDGSAVKVTIAKYYTPSGVCIDGEGITPDVIIDMDEKLSTKIQSLTLEEDVQLQKALEVVRGQIK